MNKAPKQGVKWVTAELRQEMRDLFLSGTTKTAIAHKYGCGLTTVHRATSDLKSLQQHTRKHFVNQDFFAQVGWEQAYIFGLLWADGNLYKPTSTITLSLHKDDVSVIKWVAELLNVPDAVSSHSENCVQLRFSGKKLCDDLERFGFSERKSKEGAKEFRADLLGEFFWDFIRGLIDGDGCVHYNEKTNKKVVFITGNLPTINQLQRMFEAQGLTSYVKEHPGCWRLSMSKKETLQELYRLIYKNVLNGTQGFFERKRAKFLGIYGSNPRIGRPKKNQVRSVEML